MSTTVRQRITGSVNIGTVVLQIASCCSCGVIFALTADLDKRRREDHGYFYCPNGHSQHYAGKTEAQKLREQLEAVERQRDRAQARRDHVAACVAQARALAPTGIVVCHGPTFDVLAAPLRAAGLPLLHRERIPFPLGNYRAAFVAKVRAVTVAAWKSAPPWERR